ncbi:hypothetical protein F5B17DRAFT_421508 [Nemania serpens]|nr:hypothetical protein F5B17DRAFT_421508 [Nemania serpens]
MQSYIQPILRCDQCNKPFDKQSTHKRHVYYCRSRKASKTTRSRSCIPCAKGKSACDKGRPQCVRCVNKSLQCHYPGDASRTASQGEGDASAGITPLPLTAAASPGVGTVHDAGYFANLGLPDGLDIVIPDLPAFGEGYRIEWDDDTSMATAELFNLPRKPSYPSLTSPPLVPVQVPPIPLTTQEQQNHHLPLPLPIPTAPSSAVRSLVWRPRMQPGAQRTCNLILHTLKSYPLMMLRHNSLPPFIHPFPVSSDVDDPDMEPLKNCMSLVHIISSGIQSSRKLFWKNVRLECERLLSKRLRKWELLAAMQALSIYILIRLDEGETDYNNFDSLLVKTVIAIAQQLGHVDVTCNNQCGLCNSDIQVSWKEWIFRESRRRLAIIYRVVNMLVYFEPAALCDMPAEFILAPLPERKQLWEAADEFAWKAESQRNPGLQVSFALAADGEIVKLDEGRLSCSDAWLAYESRDATMPTRVTASWEEWCAGIDGFGGLVMLAASLVS